MMKRISALILAIFIAANISGCAQLQKKFIRKKKEPVRMPHVQQVKKYEKRPSPELYQKHYVYWQTWSSELIMVLGQNHKKDTRCIDEIVGNLRDMQNLLVKEKADILRVHIEKLAKVGETIVTQEMTQANKVYVAGTLDREDRFIKRDFAPKKMKDFIRKNFND